MIKIMGTGVSPGIASGPLAFFSRPNTEAAKSLITDTQAEISRFEHARTTAILQLGKLAAMLVDKIGAENVLLFETHQLMLEDTDYINQVREKIAEKKWCAEYAVQETAKQFSQEISRMEDAYMRERAADVEDVSRRVIQILMGRQQALPISTAPSILVSDDFAPSETAQFERENVLALVTMGGAANSHTAIFARTMGIPAVIGVSKELTPIYQGKQTIVDGTTGVVIIKPNEATITQYKEKLESVQTEIKELQRYRGKETISKSGRRIKLLANIGNTKDIEAALENDAEGIGLFRSEFLYLERQDYPDEETQFQAYKLIAQKMSGRPVVIRTLDIGADKQVDYFQLPKEENPALGIRAIRLCLTRPQIFKVQLRAIYRASVFGNISIMLPMITDVNQLRRTKQIIQEIQTELAREGMDFNRHVPLGIMIETPASAIISDVLAKEADFFSIGTNDLTQYTLAIDRQNHALSQFCNPHHPALLRLIRYVVGNAKSSGILVGICGELGADPALTKVFLDMGVDELSVVPASILPLRKAICDMK
jgi:phosphotransferase system enzyme I (PtsI)